VGSDDTRHQRDGQYDNILFAIPEEVHRARQCTFKKPTISDKMTLASLC